MPITESIEQVKIAIKYNPFAADLHANLLKLYAEQQDGKGVQEEFNIVKRLAPQSEVTKTLMKAGFK